MKDGMIECSVCHSKIVSPNTKAVSRAYDRYRSKVSSKQRALNVLLVVGDCVLVGLQPILVFMSKVDGSFKFSPISVNFLTECAKVLFAIVMLLLQARRQKVGEKPVLTLSIFVQAARNNALLAVPALLYAINNYLKFIMQLYFNPATVKMLSNLKVLVIAVLLKIIMKRRFSIIQWEALALLLIGISINQLRSLPEGATALGLPVATSAYVYTLIFVTVPSLASVYNEYALKSQYDTSIYLQNLFLYGCGAIFNFLGILVTAMVKDSLRRREAFLVLAILNTNIGAQKANKKELAKNEDDIITIEPRSSSLTVHETKLKVDLTEYMEMHEFVFDAVLNEEVSKMRKRKNLHYEAIAP